MFNEISPVERIDTGLDLRAQRFQFQRIFSPPLLEHAERVTHRGIAALAFRQLARSCKDGREGQPEFSTSR